MTTPIAEEHAFRRVLTNALGRYGAWVAVPGSALLLRTKVSAARRPRSRPISH